MRDLNNLMILSSTASLNWLGVSAVLGVDVVKWQNSTLVEIGSSGLRLIRLGTNGSQPLACLSAASKRVELEYLILRDTEGVRGQDSMRHFDGWKVFCTNAGYYVPNFNACSRALSENTRRRVQAYGWSADEIFFDVQGLHTGKDAIEELDSVRLSVFFSNGKILHGISINISCLAYAHQQSIAF